MELVPRSVLRQLPRRLHEVARDVRDDVGSRRLTERFATATRDVPGAAAYADLTPFSLAVAAARPTPSVPRHLTVVLPELRLHAMFAGIRTALEVGVEMARAVGLPLRLVVLWAPRAGLPAQPVRDYLAHEFGYDDARTEVWAVGELAGRAIHPADLWLATHWSTAHPLDVAARLELVRPEHVCYLVQDYEPGFYPWSSSHALARSTYRAGFGLVVNSSPLQRYLRDAEGIEVPDELVFAPRLDLDRLARAAAQRTTPDQTVRVLFYGRPSRPRNLFDIGVAALHVATAALHAEGRPVRVRSAGELHPAVRLRHGSVEVLGKVGWDAYFDLLADSDVVLSLQHSPHPSHPPLDAVVAGGWAVTNELGGTRGSLHPRLLAAEPDPAALADQLVVAAHAAHGSAESERPGTGFDPGLVDRLGRPLGRVVEAAVASLAVGTSR